VKAVATVKAINANRSLFMGDVPYRKFAKHITGLPFGQFLAIGPLGTT